MKTAGDAKTDIRKYELGQPILRREQRMAFEAIHRTVAQSWSDAIAKDLPASASLELEGLAFETFSSIAIDRSPCAQNALFSIAATQLSGFLMMSGALARFLVTRQLGLKTVAQEKAAPFTRIEASIARETTRMLIGRLRDTYGAAKLGSIGDIRPCDDLAESFVFPPDENLAVLRFRIGSATNDLSLVLGLSSAIVSSIEENRPSVAGMTDGGNAIADVVRRLPIDVDVVLGSWKIPLSELIQLPAGQQIILPEGEDAWLAAGGVRIRRAGIEVKGNRASVEIKGRTPSP